MSREAPRATEWVLDASAVLAFLQDEPGAPEVVETFPGAVMTSVNWSEVVAKAVDAGVEVDGLRGDMEALGVRVLDFTADDAEAAGRLRGATRKAGLSLGDRACLALAKRLGVPAVTTERSWEGLVAGIPVRPLGRRS